MAAVATCILVEHLGLPVAYLPYQEVASDSSPLLDIIWRGGNLVCMFPDISGSHSRFWPANGRRHVLFSVIFVLHFVMRPKKVLGIFQFVERTIEMRIEYQFSIAGFEVSVSLPEGWDADTLLPSFRPFYGKKEGPEKLC